MEDKEEEVAIKMVGSPAGAEFAGKSIFTLYSFRSLKISKVRVEMNLCSLV